MTKEAMEGIPGGMNRLVEIPLGEYFSKVCSIVGRKIQFDIRECSGMLVYVTKEVDT